MIAKELIQKEIKPLVLTDPIKKAEVLMEEYNVQHIPVVENGVLLGIINEDLVLNCEDQNTLINHFEPYLSHAYVTDKQHLFDAISLIGEFGLSILPVLGQDEVYKGFIYPADITKAMGNILSSRIPGSILVLHINQNDYQLSQLAQIVESNDAKILALFITSEPESPKLEVTLKINRTDLTPILQTLERYEYTVAETYHKSLHSVDLHDRFENLMNYLNM